MEFADQHSTQNNTDVFDFRRRQLSSSNPSPSSSSERDDETAHEEEQPSDYGGEFGDNYASGENAPGSDATWSHPTPPIRATGTTCIQGRTIRQRFGPDEDYLLVLQVNVDAPYAAKQGDINKQWQLVADKLNGSPNFRMKTIKGETAKARFKALLAKHRKWEATSAQQSGVDEPETPFIQVMTELASNVDDYEAKVAKEAAIKKGEHQAKERSGDVVRQAAVDRIRLGKRHSRSDDSNDETKGEHEQEPSPVQLRPSTRTNGTNEWMKMFEESKKERSKVFMDFMQQQQSDLRLRLQFEKDEREKDRLERDKERDERRKEREERQKEREIQTKMIEALLERLTKND
ncbi:hypothetical protein DVH05_017254 [Phytophthora capsici]|nr:hypothetical protein DVH05_003701 [Phytophthora capsici]KAG1710249.1 hypothetical protein DVH05_017254 [Phytophthora capsici]